MGCFRIRVLLLVVGICWANNVEPPRDSKGFASVFDVTGSLNDVLQDAVQRTWDYFGSATPHQQRKDDGNHLRHLPQDPMRVLGRAFQPMQRKRNEPRIDTSKPCSHHEGESAGFIV